jgi:glycogen debranching enzyme
MVHKSLAISTLLNNTRKANFILGGDKDKDLVLLAGSGVYSDMWIRDGFLGSLGLLSTGNKDHADIVRKYIDLVTDNIRNDGLVPLRIGGSVVTQVFRILTGITVGLDVPIFYDDKLRGLPTDSNPEYIIVCCLYLKQLGLKERTEFLKNIKIKQAMIYCLKNSKDNLLHGTNFCSWYDSFRINGADLFSNVLFGYSLKIMSKLYESNEIDDFYKRYSISFRKNFMTNDGLLKIHKDANNIEIASNAFAVLFDILTKEESLKVVSFLNKIISDGNPMNVVIPKLPRKFLYDPFFIIKFEGYHNEKIWPWTNFIVMTALKKYHQEASFKKLLYKYEKSIKRHNTFHEIMEPCSEIGSVLGPCKHPVQNSEEDFTCSCGTYILLKNFTENFFRI